jgi:hypothetical protein
VFPFTMSLLTLLGVSLYHESLDPAGCFPLP